MDLSSIPEWARWQFTDERISADQMLYPDIPDGYFEKHRDALIPAKSRPESLIDMYMDMPVRPFIKKINLNQDEEAPSKDVLVIGLDLKF